MSSSALVAARNHLARLHGHVQKYKAKGEEAVGESIAAVEVFGGAVAGGFADEHWGTDDGDGAKMVKLHGVPATLLLGGLGKAGSFLGIAGKHAQHLHDISNGLLATYGSHVGRALSRRAQAIPAA